MKNSLLRHSMDGLPDCEADKVEQFKDLDGFISARYWLKKPETDFFNILLDSTGLVQRGLDDAEEP